jgi:hypothetical protein
MFFWIAVEFTMRKSLLQAEQPNTQIAKPHQEREQESRQRQREEPGEFT